MLMLVPLGSDEREAHAPRATVVLVALNVLVFLATQGFDLGKLVEACHIGNPYQQRTAWRLLGERPREVASIDYTTRLSRFAEKKIAALKVARANGAREHLHA